MTTLIIYILTALLLIGAAIKFFLDSLHNRRDTSGMSVYRGRMEAARSNCREFPNSSPGCPVVPEINSHEDITQKVNHLITRHKADKCITVALTSGAASREASLRLHSLLPGDPLCLRRNVEGGLELVDVYSDGYRVGRLLLGDAENAFKVMRDSIMTGAYVAEQNCYGDPSSVDLKIILFFTPRQTPMGMSEIADETPYKVTVNGSKPLVLFQN